MLDAAGLTTDDAQRVWVLIREQPEGTWAAGGQVVEPVFGVLTAWSDEHLGDVRAAQHDYDRAR